MQSTESAQLLDQRRFSPMQVFIVLLCMLFNMVDGFDITAMAVAASAVGEEMGLAADRLGLVFSFALAGMMIGAMSLAPVSDIIGRRKTIIIALVLVGVTVVLTSYAQNLETLVTLRFISGLGGGTLLACQATLASEYAPEKYRAFAVSAVTAGYPMGAMLTGVIAHSVMPSYGWQGLFLGGGVVALLMAVVAWAFIPESLQFLLTKQPAGALVRINNILSRLGKEPIDALPEKSEQVTQGSFISNVRSLLTPEFRNQTLIIWLVFFLCFTTLYFLMSWIPKLMTLSGFNNDVSYTAFTLFNLGGVIGIFILGLLASSFNLTRLVSVFLILSAALMVLFSQLDASKFVTLSVIFLIGIMQQGGFTGLYAVVTRKYPTEIRSTGVGWAIGLGRSGAVVGPAIAGFTIAAGVSAANNFLIFAVPMVLGGILILAVPTQE